METKEGQNLPVPHCIKDSEGWQITSALAGLPCEAIIDKPTFGSLALAERLLAEDRREKVASVVLVGLCTDICVISNAMIAKAALPEACVTVDSSCCAGVTPESHERALAAMGPCQIQVI